MKVPKLMNRDSIPSQKTILVVCAVLVDPEKKILATQRAAHQSLGGCWEFPGGKVEPGEDHEAALRRELLEELDLGLGDLVPLEPVTHPYDFGTITLMPFLSRIETRPEVHLAEHADHAWVSLEEAGSLNWAPADVPILKALEARL